MSGMLAATDEVEIEGILFIVKKVEYSRIALCIKLCCWLEKSPSNYIDTILLKEATKF